MQSFYLSTRRLTVLIAALVTSLAMNAAGASSGGGNANGTESLADLMKNIQKAAQANGTDLTKGLKSLVPHVQKVMAAEPTGSSATGGFSFCSLPVCAGKST